MRTIIKTEYIFCLTEQNINMLIADPAELHNRNSCVREAITSPALCDLPFDDKQRVWHPSSKQDAVLPWQGAGKQPSVAKSDAGSRSVVIEGERGLTVPDRDMQGKGINSGMIQQKQD